ncbi:MAG: MoaD/ThiS family protein [Deferrisomatales bacterium]|nr:MoaD/ThiS family protein [Deferrisomatales bacterium]
MVVHLKFFAGLRSYLPQGQSPHAAEVPDGATVQDVLDLFQVPRDKPRILLVNSRHAQPDQALGDGDTLSVFPPVAGG